MASSPFAFITILTTDTVNNTTSDEIAIGATNPCTASQNTSSIVNNNLGQQMEALYKSWFIDFEPFKGAKPENWSKTDIYSIADIIYGAPFSSKLFNTDGIGKPIIRIRDLKNQELVNFAHIFGEMNQLG